jgi:hypothetical protein
MLIQNDELVFAGTECGKVLIGISNQFQELTLEKLNEPIHNILFTNHPKGGATTILILGYLIKYLLTIYSVRGSVSFFDVNHFGKKFLRICPPGDKLNESFIVHNVSEFF